MPRPASRARRPIDGRTATQGEARVRLLEHRPSPRCPKRGENRNPPSRFADPPTFGATLELANSVPAGLLPVLGVWLRNRGPPGDLAPTVSTVPLQRRRATHGSNDSSFAQFNRHFHVGFRSGTSRPAQPTAPSPRLDAIAIALLRYCEGQTRSVEMVLPRPSIRGPSGAIRWV